METRNRGGVRNHHAEGSQPRWVLNGRNFTQLIALTPGVSNQTGQDEAKVGVVGSVKYSVNGGRVEYNTFEVDGSDVLNAGLNGAESTLVVYPSLDAIQEVKVLTSNYGAMYGRTASGTVLVTTKSGGAQWHGNAYEFFRNEAFNARNYFDQTNKAPLYRRNDFGFTIGGPDQERTRLSSSGRRNSASRNRPAISILTSITASLHWPSATEISVMFARAPNDPTLLAREFPSLPMARLSCRTGGSGIRSGFEVQFPNNNIFTGGQREAQDPNAAALLDTNLIPLPNSSTAAAIPVSGPATTRLFRNPPIGGKNWAGSTTTSARNFSFAARNSR